MQVYKNTLAAIPKMLQLFSQYNVHVTWATVGSMFAHSKSEWEKMAPTILPQYKNEKRSLYAWVNKNSMDADYAEAHFVPQIIKRIADTPGQEIGSHTFSHFYCNEVTDTNKSFENDLESVVDIAANLEIKIKSLVFPRNQFNDAYLATCFNAGILVVRSNCAVWYWTFSKNTIIRAAKKVVRYMNNYCSLFARISYPLSSIIKNTGKPIQLGRGRYLEPYKPGNNSLRKLRIQHIKNEMELAAKHNECYHLWWHPEEFGEHTQENLNRLQTILEHFSYCKATYKMESWNMGEIAEYFFPEIKTSHSKKYQGAI